MQSIVKVLLPRQVVLLLILSTGLLNHVILIPNLLTAAGRDSWVSVIISYPISLLFLWLIYYIVKNSPQEGFFSFIKRRLGRKFSIMLSIPPILFLFTSSYVTIRDLMIWLSAYFLSDSSILLITIFLIISCFIVTLAGVKNMAIASGVLLPIVILLGIFISLTNSTYKDPSLLLPIFADGVPKVLKGSIYVLSGLLEIYVIILLQPFLQEPIKLKHLLIVMTIFTGLILGPLTASLMEFGLESINFRYPAHEQWRILSIGEYISHLDFFALYQWLSGALIRVGLLMYLLCAFFSSKKHNYILNPKVVIFVYLILFISMLINVESHYFFNLLYLYYLPLSFLFFFIQIILSALLLFILKKRDEQHDKNNKFESSS